MSGRNSGPCTGLRCGSWISLLLLAALPGFGQERSEWAPARLEGVDSAIGLQQALELTLEHQADIRLAEKNAEVQRGAAAEAGGDFDAALELELSFELAQGSLEPLQIASEENRREFEERLQRRFRYVRDQLQTQLDDIRGGTATGEFLASCPEGTIVIVDGTLVCLARANADRQNDETFRQLLNRLEQDARNEGNNELAMDLGDNRAFQDQLREDTLIQTIALLNNAIYESEERLTDYGEIPDIQERWDLIYDLRYKKLQRNGLGWAAGLILEGVEDNYDGKPLCRIRYTTVLGELRRIPGCANSRYGGKGTPNLFTATVGFELDVPLGKGRGVRSTGAAEEASLLNHRASLFDSAQTASESLLATLSAYWSLSAAQERLELLEKAVETEQELHDMAVALVEGDELPQADLARVQARVASAHQSAAQARQAVHEARMTLADSIGLVADDPRESPLARDRLPEPAPAAELHTLEAGKLIRGALENRADVNAARILMEAAKVLLEAAELDLKRRVDLSLSAGYQGLYESCRENDLSLSEECLEFWDPQGLWEALKFDRDGFIVDFRLEFDIPFRNRVAKGQLEQALAQARQSEIESRNLEREVALSIAQLYGSLERAGEELEERESSTRFYEQTLDAAMELFRAGEGTLIDTILTEEQLTSSRLALVNAKVAYAAILAELRFATGALVSHRLEEDQILIEGIHPDGLEFPL